MIKNKTLDIKIILKILKTGFCFTKHHKIDAKHPGPISHQNQELSKHRISLQH